MSVAVAWGDVKGFLSKSKQLDALVARKKSSTTADELAEIAQQQIERCTAVYDKHVAKLIPENVSDARLRSLARYTDGLPTYNFRRAMHLVPALVNVVSLADAIPLRGSALPFDLRAIAQKVEGAVYFAPRRFTAVQLAFDQPRSRTLLFHTGRIVGTGCNGAQAARLAVSRAIHAIAEQAGVYIGVRRFSVINQVGAVALGASLDCDAFADAHRSDAHFDRQSFVGLAWRPAGEVICAEAYSTGKMNLPGSRRERHLLASYGRMVAELFRYSSKPENELLIDEPLRSFHKSSDRPAAGKRKALPQSGGGGGSSSKQAKTVGASVLWDDDEADALGLAATAQNDDDDAFEGFDDLDAVDGLF